MFARRRLLGGQNPRRRQRRNLGALRLRKIIVILSVLFLTSYALFIWNLRQESSQVQTVFSRLPFFNSSIAKSPPPQRAEDGSLQIPLSQNWQVSVVSDKAGWTQSKDHQKVVRTAKKFLRTAHRDELHFIARYLMHESSFDKVVVTRRQPEEILVRLSSPQAAAVIAADKLRYVSDNGNIFGQASSSHDELALITGIFDDTPVSYSMTSSNKLLVPKEISQKILSVLKAMPLVKEAGFQIISVNHDSFRGLKLVLAGSMQVMLGHPPFDKKIKRLRSIVNQAEDAQQRIQKIELDYKGKAFIKKMPKESSSL